MSTTCIDFPYSQNLRNSFYLSLTQQIIIYIISPFIYLSGIFTICFFLKGKRKAEPPADILLFICIFGIFRISSYIGSTIFTEVYPPSLNAQIPENFNSFCLGTGFINVMCEISSFVYNIIFGIYYMIKIKNPLKSWIKQHRQLHIFCIFVIIITTLIFYLTDLIGISILGVCGFKIGTGTIFLQFGMAICYFIVMIVSSFIFIIYLRKVSKLDHSTKIYFKFYFKYLFITAFSNLIALISLIVVSIKCLANSSDQLYQIFATICILARLLSPFFVFLIILSHPQAKISSILRYFNKFIQKNTISYENNNKQIGLSLDNQLTKRNTLMIQLKTLNSKNLDNNDGYLSRIKDNNKACLISTILSCLCLQQNQFIKNSTARESVLIYKQNNSTLNKLAFQKFEQQDLYSWNFSQRYEFNLTQYIIQQFEYLFSDKLPSIKIKFTAFNPAVFKRLQRQQSLYNFYQKLLPQNNQKNILNQIQSDGGRSGQFFFYNFDCTLIIKTINEDQLDVVLTRMQSYYGYFQTNQNSLIVKIFGIYKVNNYETDQQFAFMLMGNILKDINKKYILRSYDMKGSRYQRQVLTNQQLQNQGDINTKKTLKDIDFQTLQGKININQQQSDQLKKHIQKDIIFLSSQGLIDYSLIVIKINYQLYLKQHHSKEIQNIKIYKSTTQEGVAYVLGIIDYLETWNIKKKSQKWYKSIFNKQNDISSQNPQYYAERFIKNLVNVILP